MRLEMTPAELASWREHPATKCALEWLAARMATYTRDIPLFIVKNRIDDARAAAGALQGYAEVLAAFTEVVDETPAETEEEFHDPAARPSTKEKS